MTEFQSLVQDVIKHYRNQVSSASLPCSRRWALEHLKDELVQLKEMYTMLNPEADTSMPAWSEITKQLV